MRELLHSPGSSPKRTTPGSSSPGAVHWQQQQHPGVRQQSPAGKLSLAAGGTWGSPSPTKRTQQQQQQWRPGSPLSTLAAGSEGGGNGGYGAASEPYKALQQQLLSDVDAVRKRQKPGFIRCVCGQPSRVVVVECCMLHPLSLHTIRVVPPAGRSCARAWSLSARCGPPLATPCCWSTPWPTASGEMLCLSCVCRTHTSWLLWRACRS